jgi:hypothetical protein
MLLFSLHVDRQLARLATSGTLPPRQWGRVLRHARACARCGPRYERVVNVHRVLAHGTLAEPTAAELESVAALGLKAALSAAGAGGLRSRLARAVGARRRERGAWALAAMDGWRRPGFIGGLAAVAACALVLLAVPRQEEWMARGEGSATAVLRVFCVPEDAELHEVKTEGRCPSGAALAFAAAVRPPLTHAVVVLRGAEGLRVEGPFEVKTPPGAEATLDVTPRLPASGVVEVTTVFAASAQQALAAARGEAVQGAVRVQHRVRVEEAAP